MNVTLVILKANGIQTVVCFRRCFTHSTLCVSILVKFPLLQSVLELVVGYHLGWLDRLKCVGKRKRMQYE